MGSKVKMPKGKTIKKILSVILKILTVLFVVLGFMGYFSAIWCNEKYGKIGFDAVLFTLFSDIGGTSEDLIQSYINDGLIPALGCSVLVLIPLMFRSKSKIVLEILGKVKLRIFPLRDLVSAAVALVLCVPLLWNAADIVEAGEWLQNLFTKSVLYEEEYADPDNTDIIFPEEKRNLIYIYLESMENTFLSKDLGGALDYNTIPELYSLADENINFSQNSGVGGCRQISGATWTVGAMVAQTAGIPLRLPNNVGVNSYGEYSSFLPGVTSITDVLHENGYYQAFMCGSDANFGGRYQYFNQHGVDRIYDYYTAVTDNIIPEWYFEWWGLEDYYLFDYAKEELPKLAMMDQPFAFTMLTADTHHIDGYFCKYCKNEYEEQYENVYACSSRQVTEFVKWITEQDFYENTTIIITGDHVSMDNQYMSRNVSNDYTRRIYNCFINAAAEPQKAKNREFSQFDMFPSTLAALGCTVEDNRLGLGVNLFSDVPTLAERYGFDELETLVSSRSSMYDSKFLLG